MFEDFLFFMSFLLLLAVAMAVWCAIPFLGYLAFGWPGAFAGAVLMVVAGVVKIGIRRREE